MPDATPQVVPKIVLPGNLVMSPYLLSLSADSVSVSSAGLVFFTSTPYLMVAQLLVVETRLLVIVPVVAASATVTVTLLDVPEVGVVPSEPTPLAVAISITFVFSPWLAAKVHE